MTEKRGVQLAYDAWSAQYDTNVNKTRDLEAAALRAVVAAIDFATVLEIGCGTGKNTVTLLGKAERITAVDLSPGMLAKARERIVSPAVNFIQADICGDWNFADGGYDLLTFSLMLEHIQDVHAVFRKAAQVVRSGGYVYVGELHPFKQYTGSKARFETGDGVHVVTCYNHHVSEFTDAAAAAGFSIEKLTEYFDDDDRTQVPRILSVLFKKT